MKRISAFLLLLLACGVLGGCGEQNFDSPDEEDAALSEDVIAWFNTEYFNTGEGINMRNMMLSSQYSTATDIDLFRLFYNGISESHPEISEEERTALSEYDTSARDLDVIKITRSMIDDFLMEYAKVKLADTNRNGLDHFFYLEEYDAYYLIHSDTNYARCKIISGEAGEDGSIVLDYEMEGRKAAVTLKSIEGNYSFVSNVAK